jgi:periplasmic protein TonB
MFGESLLESSPAARKGKRWPMATAFTLEMIVATVVVVVPLLSTGVIPLSARPPVFTPLGEIPRERVKPAPENRTTNGGPASASHTTEVVLVSDNPNAIHIGKHIPTTTDPTEARPGNLDDTGKGLPDGLVDKGNGDNGPVVKPGQGRISVPSEAQLINRVEPVYPKIAVAAGVQGQVKLHAIIARDGRVVGLNVISGHPLLVRAAEDAVSQWRYRPYYLNGEAVEVETFITVNFKREGR